MKIPPPANGSNARYSGAFTGWDLSAAFASDAPPTVDQPGVSSLRFNYRELDGDEKRVREYLKDGIDVNSRDWDNLTAVVAAASAGHTG